MIRCTIVDSLGQERRCTGGSHLFLTLVAWLLGSLSTVIAKDDLASTRKNVLLIVADDLTASALGCYGNRQCQTPNLDRLAEKGVRFNHAYCQFPVCGPSRAAMMSGMYCQSIGVTGNGSSSRYTENLGDRVSLAEHFKGHGWYTARVSKIYHMRVPGDITAGVDGPDHAASWTERFNCKGPEWMSKGKHQHLSNEKLKRLPDKHYNLGFGTAFYSIQTESPQGEFQPDKLAADKAIELLKFKRDKPFFLAVGLVRPHVPLVAPRQYFEQHPHTKLRLAERVDGDWDDIPRMGISKNSWGTGLFGKTEKQQRVLQAYYASVSFMDHQVGRILKALDEAGIRENTIVIFKSDHGYHLGEHDLWQKMSLHEESARIPLIVSSPGKKQGVVSNSHAEAIDLFPTLSEECGLKVPVHCQGKSLSRILENAEAKVRDSAFCMTGKGRLIRTRKWAYIQYRDGSQELYDMESDSSQFTNLAQSRPEIVERMKSRFSNHSPNRHP